MEKRVDFQFLLLFGSFQVVGGGAPLTELCRQKVDGKTSSTAVRWCPRAKCYPVQGEKINKELKYVDELVTFHLDWPFSIVCLLAIFSSFFVVDIFD